MMGQVMMGNVDQTLVPSPGGAQGGIPPLSFEGFLQHNYPVPEEDKYFAECWGYEEC